MQWMLVVLPAYTALLSLAAPLAASLRLASLQKAVLGAKPIEMSVNAAASPALSSCTAAAEEHQGGFMGSLSYRRLLGHALEVRAVKELVSVS